LKNKKIFVSIISILFLFSIISPVFAQPSTNIQISTTEFDFQIFYPIIEYYKEASEVHLNFAVLNESHALLTNETTTCNLWVNYRNGTELVSNQELNFSNNYFQYTMNETQTRARGTYSYFIYCNDSVNGGGLVSFFKINGNGEEINSEIISIYIVLMGFLFIVLGFCVLGAINYSGILGKFAFIVLGWFALVSFVTTFWIFLDSYLINFIFFANIFKMFTYILWGLTPIFVILCVVFIFLYALSSRAFYDLVNSGLDVKDILDREGNAFFRWFWRHK